MICKKTENEIAYSEYNLEFQGSNQNLQKRTLFMNFTKKCLEITQKRVKITLLLAKRALFVKCYKGQHLITGHWFLLDYSLVLPQWKQGFADFRDLGKILIFKRWCNCLILCESVACIIDQHFAAKSRPTIRDYFPIRDY